MIEADYADGADFCFNTNNLDKVPYLISDNESLLDAPFLNRFFNRHLQTRKNEIRLEILNEFRNDTNACCQQLELILAGMPSEWEPNRKYLKERLDFFFSDYWLTQCQNFFTRLFVQNLNSNENEKVLLHIISCNKPINRRENFAWFVTF